ncbi:MAG: phosphomannomutase/phosphoglucomutase [Myxococcales bacterium]|nr:phosphomannomutase/phosphoglucomutase [Myxococcales bacterium]
MPFEIPRHVFREYDIRGVAARDLSDELVTALGAAFAEILSRGGWQERARVAVCRDCRLSSDRLFAALTSGLTRAGVDVVDLGVGPTPLLYFGAQALETDGAVMITGSHNPPDENGFKLLHRTVALSGAEVREVADVIEARQETPGPEVEAAGTVSARDLATEYVAAVRQGLRLEGLVKKPRVVVDAGNGAAGPLGVRTLRELGFEVDALYCDMDGRFPNHHPDPTEEHNLVALRARVAELGADLGIAWDGDGDRLGVIDRTGAIVWGDKLMILFARALLAERPGATILGEVKCSETLYADIRARGGRAIVGQTGHSLIKKRMKQEGAALAGEMSGHLFFADRYFGYDDAIYAAARLLEIVAREGKGPDELLADVPRTASTPEIRVPCPDELKFRVVERVLAHYRSRYRVLEVDGARIDFGGGAWGLCRASNTQSVLVLRFEAHDASRRDAVRADVEAVVEEAKRALGAA